MNVKYDQKRAYINGVGGMHVKRGRRTTNYVGNAPYDFEKTKLETVRPLLSHTKIRKNEETRVSVVILGILEVIERRDD